ncbi:MAG: FHA domain-containing protein [Planctomycetes bacterium]|nr:FHA domain-containing protein [Planctomycetota bacterium]
MPRLLVDELGERRVVDLGDGAVTVGRARDATVMIRDAKSSRHHLRIEGNGPGYFVEDLGSSNGTLLNGKATRRAPLAHGDVIHIGEVSITYIDERAPAAGAPEAPAAIAVAAAPAGILEEPAAAAPESPVLVVQAGERAGERVPLAKSPFSIGRKPENDLALGDNRVSGVHCRIVREGPRWYVEDLDSGNGVLVGGKRIKRQPLHNGDVVALGTTELRFEGVPAATAALGASPSVILHGVDSSEISEDELSRLAVRHSEERESPLQALWTGIFILSFLAILYLTYDLVSTHLRREGARLDPASLLAMNPSFEDASAGGTIPGWSVDPRGDAAKLLALAEPGLPDGKQALLARGSGGVLGFTRVVSEQRIVPASDDALRLSGMVRSRKFRGAGLELIWVAGTGATERVVVEAVSPLIEPRPTFTPLSIVMTPPPLREITACRVAAIGIGDGELEVDGLVLKPEAGVESEPCFLASAGEHPGIGKIRLDFRPDGSFSVMQGSQVPIASLRVAAREAGKFPFGQLLAFNADPPRLRENGIVRGTFAFQEGRALIASFEESAQQLGESIRVTWRLIEGALPSGDSRCALIVELDARAALGSMTAFRGGELAGSGSGPALLDGKIADEWIIGERDNQVVVSFSQPLRMEALPPPLCRGVPTIALVLDDPLPDRALEILLGAASPQEESRIRSLFAAADAARKEGKAWRAIEILAALDQEFAWREDVNERTKGMRADLEEEGKRLREELAGLAKDFERFPDSPVRPVFLRRAEEAARAFRGTETGRVAESLVADIKAKTREDEARRSREDAGALYLRGKSYFDAKQDGLARLYLEWVVAAFPDTNEAQQARELLERVQERKRRL